MAWIQHFHGFGRGWWLQLQLDPQPGNLHIPWVLPLKKKKISKLEDRSLEIFRLKDQKKKKKKNEDKWRAPRGFMEYCQVDQCTYYGSPKRREKKRAESLFEEIMVKKETKTLQDKKITGQEFLLWCSGLRICHCHSWAWICSLAWELPYTMGVARRKRKKKITSHYLSKILMQKSSTEY